MSQTSDCSPVIRHRRSAPVCSVPVCPARSRSLFGLSILWLALVACGVLSGLGPNVQAQSGLQPPASPDKPKPPEEPAPPEQPGGDEEEDEEVEESDKEDEEPDTGFSPSELSALQGHFATREIKFLGDREIELTYSFEKNQPDLADDFSPPLKKVAKRMRLSHGWGDSHSTVDDGLVVNKFGIYLHNAEWDSVQIDVRWGQLSEISRPDDVVAAVFAFGKKRNKFVASNLGRQCVRLSKKVRFASRPVPAVAVQPPNANTEVTFGLRVKDGKVTALRAGRDVHTTDNKKICRGLGPGLAGLAWNGTYVKGMIPTVVLKGRLTEQWMRKYVFGGAEEK